MDLTNKEKLLKISHELFNRNKDGINFISLWLLSKNGYIYTFRQCEKEKNNIISLLEENHIPFEIKNNLIGEILMI